VEGDPSVMMLYTERLQQAGFRTASAVEIQEGFEALPKVSADLIILDLMLPKPGGLALLKAIRSDSRHSETPVLVLSNAYLTEMAQEALRAGGNKALPRSECTSSELISVSRELVGIEEPRGTEHPDASEGPDGTCMAEQLEKDFLEEGSTEVASIRQHYFQFVELLGTEEAKEHLDRVYQSVRLLSARAGLAGFGRIGQLTGVMEAMLFERVSQSEAAMSPSSMRTLAKAVDCLGRLFTSGDTGSAKSFSKARVLVVDNDETAILTNEVALKRANYDVVSATDGAAALELLDDNYFDLILLDINLPGMRGAEACQKLRCLPHHKNTPIIFVTPDTDFQNHAQSALSGGGDLISKPISPLELIVKTTVLLLSTSRTQVPREEPCVESPASPPGLMAEQPKPEGGPNKLHTLQSAIEAKLNYLRQALAEESKRREAVEQHAAENAKRRTELETAIEENQRSQQWFQQLLQESQLQAPASEEGGKAGPLNLSGRRRALVAVQDFVADKLIRLKEALTEETKRREAVEQEIAETAERRTELETALGEIQRVQDAFQQEAETAANPKRLIELESSLAASQQARETLEGELDAARRKIQALRHRQVAEESELEARTPGAEQSELEERTRELQVAQVKLDQEVGRLKKALAAETERRDAVMRQAAEHAQCRGELEAALAENDQTKKTLRRELEASESAKQRGELEAELAENKQTQARLRHDLEASQRHLQAQQQSAVAEQATLQARTQELRAAQAEMEQQIKRLTEAFAEESKRRQGAEQQAGEINQRRRELEAQLGQLGQQLQQTQTHLHAETQLRQEWQQAQQHMRNVLQLAENQHAQAQSRQQMEEAQQQQRAQEENYLAEQAKLKARTQELQSVLAPVEQKVKQLTEELAKETKRREGAERQAGELDRRRSELEAELATNKQAQERLRQQLAEVKRQLRAAEENYIAERSRLEAQMKELQAAQALLQQKSGPLAETPTDETRRPQDAEQRGGEVAQPPSRATWRGVLNAVRQFVQDTLRRLLKAKSRQDVEHEAAESPNHREEPARQESPGAQQSEFADLSQELQAAHLDLLRRVMRLTEMLAKETRRREGAMQQAREIDKRRCELEALLGPLREDLTASQNQLQAQQDRSRAQQTELEERIKGMQSAQAELEQQVKRLATRHDTTSQRIDELEGQSQVAARTIQTRDQELGALRHAILDASRISSKISHERLQVDGQMVEGWKRLITTLLHTPLSMAQRGLVVEVVSALEGWTKGRTDAMDRVESRVEPPDIHHSEFNCTEVIECALATVREDTDQIGAKIQVALVGPVPERAHGSPRHIHQLITLLAASLPEVGHAENLEVQVSFKTMQNGSPELLLSLLLSSSGSEENLRLRLTSLTEASATLRIVRCGGPELALASAWQLALALGGSPSIEITKDRQVRVAISLPLQATSSLCSENKTRQASVETN
jgi:DNA-binding response OmpR family regulator